jgi:hypothetical protein
VPGDRVQIDVCKIVPAVYQYTAIDDCSGAVGRVVGIWGWRNLRLVQPARAGVVAPAEITP